MNDPGSEIVSIFADALDCESPAARAAHLDRMCGNDAPLRAQVEALLQAHDEAGSFLKGHDAPVGGDPAAEDARRESIGTLIGPYKLLEEIGEGGMGIVYMADQQSPIHRRVALKIIKPGMDTRQVIARLEVERQALALMDHPNIARVLDAGTTPSGLPYFVMELVRGIPITDYCDQNHLTVRERLELFVAACQAVQHAHQKGIIHRDLKPSNILVTLQDGRPMVKVIDFGVAKAINQQLTEKTLFTSFRQMVGTPLYMSPEQAEMSSVDVDTRSDVYSLGVLLFELLTGTTPFDVHRLREAAYDEIRRIIREEEPPLPSARFITLGETRVTVAAQRGVAPDRLNRLLRSDLDWIVMRALEKDRARRYESADGLTRDVQRYLADQPVEASPPSTAYRLRKFARRNRVALLTALLVSTALVLGTIVSAWQAIRATRAEHAAQAATLDEARQRSEADRQRAHAQANYQRARAAIDKYFTLVSESKLLDVPGLQSLRKDLLESALDFYKDFALERTNDPALLADLAVTYLRLSEINHAVDRNDEAVASINQALDVIDRLQREFPNDVHHLRTLAGYWKGFRRVKTRTELPKDTKAALESLTRLIETLQSLGDQFPQEPGFQTAVAALCHRTGDLLSSGSQTAKAVPYYERARAIFEKLSQVQPDVSEHRADLARAYEHLAGRLPDVGRKKEAAAAAREGLALRERLVAEFPSVPQYRAELAYSSVQCASFVVGHDRQEAGKLYRRGLELAESLAREYPGTLFYDEQSSRALVEWAGFVIAGGDPAESQQAVVSLLTQLDAILARQPHNPSLRYEIARSLKNLAEHLYNQPNTFGAREDLFRRALDLYMELAREFPDDSNYLEQAGHVGRHLGWMTRDAGRLDDGQQDFTNALAVFEKLATDDIPQRDGFYRSLQADTLMQIAIVLARGEHHAEAEPLAGRSAEIFGDLVDEFSTNKGYRTTLAYVHRLRAEQLVPMSRSAEAEACYRRSIELNPKDFWTHLQFGKLLHAGGRFVEAETCFRQARAIDPHEPGAGHLLVDVLARQDKLPQAIDEATSEIRRTPEDADVHDFLWALLQASGDGDHSLAVLRPLAETLPECAPVQQNLAIALAEQQSLDEAASTFARAIDLLDKLPAARAKLPDNRARRAACLRGLAGIRRAQGELAEAEGAYRRAIECDERLLADFPKFPAAQECRQQIVSCYFELARLFVESNRSPEAAVARQKAFELAPTDAVQINQWAWELATAPDRWRRNPRAAVELAAKAVELDPTNVEASNTLGAAHYRSGNWMDAIRWLEKSLTLRAGGDSFDWFFLAMTHWHLDHQDEARKWYAKAVDWMEQHAPQDQQLIRFRTEAQELMGVKRQPSTATSDKDKSSTQPTEP